MPRDFPRDLPLGTIHVVEAAFPQGSCLDLTVCPREISRHNGGWSFGLIDRAYQCKSIKSHSIKDDCNCRAAIYIL